jgi:hypothetical protein
VNTYRPERLHWHVNEPNRMLMAAKVASMNVVSAPKPWTTGMTGVSLGRDPRRAGNGSASMLAIISSVTVKASVSVSSLGGTPPPGDTPDPDPDAPEPPAGTTTG